MKTFKQILIFIVGLSSIGLGGALFILSNIGSDPFNVLMQGLSGVIGITVGQSNIMVSAIYAVLIFFLDRSYLKIGTLIAIVVLGAMIDIGITALTPFFQQDLAFIIRLSTMLAGNVFIALGVAIIYSARLGMVPNDALSLIVADKVNKPFKWVKIGYDVFAVIIGVCLGGIFGVGTVISALITGPLIAFFMPRMKRVSDVIVS